MKPNMPKLNIASSKPFIQLHILTRICFQGLAHTCTTTYSVSSLDPIQSYALTGSLLPEFFIQKGYQL